MPGREHRRKISSGKRRRATRIGPGTGCRGGARVRTRCREQPEPLPPVQPDNAQAASPEFNLVPTLKLAENAPPLDGRAGQSWTVYRAEPDGSRGAYVSTEYGDWKGNLAPGALCLDRPTRPRRGHQRLTVEAGKTVEPVVVLNAGTLKVRPVAAPGREPDPNAVVRFDYPGGNATGYGESSIVLPAGVQTITVRSARPRRPKR